MLKILLYSQSRYLLRKIKKTFTAQKCNYKDFKELAVICKRHHVDKLWWDRVVTEDKGLYLSSDEFQKVVDICNKLMHNHNPFKNYSFVSNQRSLQCFGTNDCGYNCNAGKNLLIILADGSVMPCRRLPFIVGNLLEQNLEEVYSNKIMKSLQTFIAPQECLGCKEYFRCKGGAKCVTYAQTGKWDIKDVNCPFTDKL